MANAGCATPANCKSAGKCQATARVDHRDPTPENEVERLRGLVAQALPYLEYVEADEVSYGYFLGGDPRKFSPDPECSTPEEQAAWKADCEAWDRGEPHSHQVVVPIDPERSIAGQLKGADTSMLIRDEKGYVVGGHVHRAGYGLGSSVIRDEDGARLVAELRAIVSGKERGR